MMGARLGWNAKRIETEIAEYRRNLRLLANGIHNGLGGVSNGGDEISQVADSTLFSEGPAGKPH
jgi:hypothetical protein